MEYEVVEKDGETLDGSSWGEICEERNRVYSFVQNSQLKLDLL